MLQNSCFPISECFCGFPLGNLFLSVRSPCTKDGTTKQWQMLVCGSCVQNTFHSNLYQTVIGAAFHQGWPTYYSSKK
jgi:hypothetical protein